MVDVPLDAVIDMMAVCALFLANPWTYAVLDEVPPTSMYLRTQEVSIRCLLRHFGIYDLLQVDL